MLRHSFVSPSRREGPPSIWDTHGISGNVFANPDASSSAPYPQELHQWNSSIEEPLHSSTVEKSERQEQDQDLRCQSGPSAKNSVILSGGDSSKNYGADQQRLQILDLHFDMFPTPSTFACWKIRFKTERANLQRNRRSRLVTPMKKLLARTNTAGVRLTSSRPSSWNPGPPRGSDQRAFSRPPFRTLAHFICFQEGRGFVTCSSFDDVNRTPSHVTFPRVCPHSL